MSPPLLIIAAVDRELKDIRSRLSSLSSVELPHGKAWSGFWRGHPIWLVRSGVGPKKARKTISALFAEKEFKFVISIGYAGALDPDYKVGDIVIPLELRTTPPLKAYQTRPNQALFKRALAVAQKTAQSFHDAPMITSDRVITSSREKLCLGKAQHAGSVEMESAVIAELAQQADIPFLAVRVILDEAAFSLPDALQMIHWWRHRKWSRLVSSFLRQPFSFFQLLWLARNTRISSAKLTLFLNNYFHTLPQAGL